jgi:hydrogenase maturation protein HypF
MGKHADREAGSAGRLVLKVQGTVQGVGFRPSVYAMATSMKLSGFVANTSEGVVIEVEGPGSEEFPDKLRQGLPPLAEITSMAIDKASIAGYEGFEIRQSLGGGGFTLISPDVSVCDDCLSELSDASDRRYRYPFINCTNCGPRYTITRAVPYDRPNTTMDAFSMCPACQSEYEDPSDRRFHAVPNACPVCGPKVWLVMDGFKVEHDDPIALATEMLREGRILALKGLGGFHLACDALNADAVEELRKRKQRVRKPFALMAPDMEVINKFCYVSEHEEALLMSARRPVVLLRKKEDSALPEAIAPGNRDLGFMLPYTPLHRLLMEGLEVAVMTSGNMSEEPIQHINDEARSGLDSLADAFLLHDREIFMRVDDSVVRAAQPSAVFIRRARGYAPESVALTSKGPDVLAVGADMKNTFTILKDDRAIVSQHMGDMDRLETVEFFEQTLSNLCSVYSAMPEALAHDMHPAYGSTRWALSKDIPKLAVQHHHAHIAGVMAEHGLSGKVIGVALDGTGYGPDGKLWGGEFLLTGFEGFARLGQLSYIRLPGGERAIREPWRIAAGVIDDVFGSEARDILDKLGFVSEYGESKVSDILRVSKIDEFSPQSSGAGRYFDAASAILGICSESSFEGEAAMALEGAASLAPGETGSYEFGITQDQCPALDFKEVFRQMALDRTGGRAVPEIAMSFHNTVARAVVEAASGISQVAGVKEIALSGGVFQNVTLLNKITGMLESAGLNVYFNRQVPANDAGVSLGQAVILRHQMDKAK